MPSRLAALLATVLLAGCLAPPEPGVAPPAATEDPAPAAADPPAPDAAPREGGASPPERSEPPEANRSRSPLPARADPPWPAIESAKIRPGMQVGFWRPGVVGVLEPDMRGVVADCTANFVFASPDNATLYLGTAAHCIDHLAIGDSYPLGRDAVAVATLAYSSWHTMRERGEGDDEEAWPLRENDFALLAIAPKDRGLVHPAMLGYGGPVAVADVDTIAKGSLALAYGNSDTRRGTAELAPREGCVSWVEGWVARFWSANPSVSGDSGAPVLTADGRALGVLTRIGGFRMNANDTLEHGNGLTTNLEPALAYARAAGFDVRLATWPLLAPPNTPAAACGPFE